MDRPTGAAELILPAVYNELRRLARAYLRSERPDHTLQATALVHEAYLRLVRQHPTSWQDRRAFVGIAAHLMRQILVEHARARGREKRGGKEQHRVALDEATAAAAEPFADASRWEAIDQVLERLEAMSPRQAKIVELRYFAGLSVEETATVLDLSPKTVKRDWSAARAWLRRELGDPSTAHS